MGSNYLEHFSGVIRFAIGAVYAVACDLSYHKYQSYSGTAGSEAVLSWILNLENALFA